MLDVLLVIYFMSLWPGMTTVYWLKNWMSRTGFPSSAISIKRKPPASGGGDGGAGGPDPGRLNANRQRSEILQKSYTKTHME